MEYDILPKMELSYKILKTKKFDIGTPERQRNLKIGYVKNYWGYGNVGKRFYFSKIN